MLYNLKKIVKYGFLAQVLILSNKYFFNTNNQYIASSSFNRGTPKLHQVYKSLGDYSSKLSNLISEDMKVINHSFSNLNNQLKDPNFNISNVKLDGERDVHTLLNQAFVQTGLLGRQDIHNMELMLNDLVKSVKLENVENIGKNAHGFVKENVINNNNALARNAIFLVLLNMLYGTYRRRGMRNNAATAMLKQLASTYMYRRQYQNQAYMPVYGNNYYVPQNLSMMGNYYGMPRNMAEVVNFPGQQLLYGYNNYSGINYSPNNLAANIFSLARQFYKR